MSDKEPQVVRTVVAQPYHVTLQRSAKGQYYWEVSVHTDDPEECVIETVKIDQRLQRIYAYGEKEKHWHSGKEVVTPTQTGGGDT